jgi:hypothetical protein
MSRLRRHRPTPALVVAVIVLFVAVGGTAYGGFRLPENRVGQSS